MPKITARGGPTNKDASASKVDEDIEEVDESLAGNSSSPSTKKNQTSQEKPLVEPQKPAQTTGSHSPKGKMASSSASSTAGRQEPKK